jgi:metal-responsive CopG/Arc/MetJ family transcriptional regulator
MQKLPKSQKDIEIINVRVPKEILSILDSLVKKNIYTSRSEAIREFSREYVLEQRLQNRN